MAKSPKEFLLELLSHYQLDINPFTTTRVGGEDHAPIFASSAEENYAHSEHF